MHISLSVYYALYSFIYLTSERNAILPFRTMLVNYVNEVHTMFMLRRNHANALVLRYYEIIATSSFVYVVITHFLNMFKVQPRPPGP